MSLRPGLWRDRTLVFRVLPFAWVSSCSRVVFSQCFNNVLTMQSEVNKKAKKKQQLHTS